MIFHENRLLADDSHELSFLISFKIRKDVAKFVVCCSPDWRFKGLQKSSDRTAMLFVLVKGQNTNYCWHAKINGLGKFNAHVS